LTLVLDNDSDTVALHPVSGVLLSKPVVKASLVENGNSVSGTITVSPPSSDWDGLYSYDNKSNTLTINEVLSGFT
jgi:hypothetical protein